MSKVGLLALIVVVVAVGVTNGQFRLPMPWFPPGVFFNRVSSMTKEKARITYTFPDPLDSARNKTVQVEGLYGHRSKVGTTRGHVIHVVTEDGGNQGCTQGVNLPRDEDWIALIQRGGCGFHTKIRNHAVDHNASAVVIYNDQDSDDLITMFQMASNVISVFIGKDHGDTLAALVDLGTQVEMRVEPAPKPTTPQPPPSDPSSPGSPERRVVSAGAGAGRWVPGRDNSSYAMLVFIVLAVVVALAVALAFVVWKYQLWKKHPLAKKADPEEPATNYNNLEESK